MPAINEIKIKISLLLDDASRRLSELNNRLGNLGSGDNKAKKALDDTEKSAGVLGSTMGRVSSDIKGLLAGAFAVGTLVAFTHKLVETVKVAQDLRLRLSGMTQGNADLAQSEAYLTDLSHKHHKSVQDLTASYASLLVLEKAGVTNRQQSMQLLEGLSNAGAALGATNTQIAQSVYGLSQALGQGTVQSTEFNQIIEPLTGLGNEIAKAFGAENVAVLRKWISEGKITSEMLGEKMPIALKAYLGAAERSGKTITGNYNDIANAYTEMAKELEKPVATAAIGVVNVGKEAYGWLKDNGDTVINLLTGIALVMLGKSVSAISAYTSAGVKSIVVEQAHTAAIIENEQRSVTARLEKVRLAEAKAADRLATVRSTTAELTATTTASDYSAAVIRLTAAIKSQAAAEQFLVGQNAKLAESQLALTAATNTSGVMMTRFKSLIALLGGEIGLAVIAVYGLVKAGESLLNVEERANSRAMTLANSLGIMNDQVKALSAEQVDIDFSKTTAKIDALKKQLEALSIADKFKQYFSYGIGPSLDQQLETQEQRATALTNRKLADTKEFDATKLKPEDRASALKATEDEMNYHAYRLEELKASTGDRSTIDALISENQVYMAALQAKHSAIKSVMDAESKTGKVDPKIAEANAKAEEKTIASGFKLKAELAKNAYEADMARAEKDSVKKLEIERAYNAQALALTLERLNAEMAAKTKTSELSGKKTKAPELQAELADLENQKLAAIDNAKTKGVMLDIDQQQQAANLREKQQAAEHDLALSRIDTELLKVQAEQKTALDNLKRDKEQGQSGGNFASLDRPQTEKGKLWELVPQVTQYLMSKGWTKPQAAGIAANLWEESNFKTTAVGDKTMKDKATGKMVARPESGWAFGIGQWREERADTFQEKYGKHLKDATLKEQLDYYDWEIRTKKGESKARNAMLSASTPQAAATAGVYFERPADQASAIARRGGLAGEIAKRTGDVSADTMQRVTNQDEKQLINAAIDSEQRYTTARIAVQNKGIDAQIAAIKEKLALAEQEYTTKKATATPEELPKLNADYTANKEKLTQELTQLQADLLAIKKDGDAELLKETNRLKQEELDIEEASALELIKLAETEAQQQLELGQLSNGQFLAKQQDFENQRYQIALKAAQDRRALLDDGDAVGKAKFLAQEKSLTTKHAADVKAINHKMALDSQQTFNSIVSPIKSAFGSTIQGILQGTTTLKQGMKNAFQSIVLSFANSLASMAIDAVAHWAWELLGFGAKETTKVAVKTTAEAGQTAATAAGVASRTGVEAAGSATSKAIEASTGMSKITTKAASAAAGAYDALVGTPFIGPVIAPIAAAAAFVGVMAFGSLISSSAGGEWDVPHDRLNFVHKNETILPANIAAPMREFFTQQGNLSYGLPASAMQALNPQTASTLTTAASVLAVQQSLMQAQQKQQARASGRPVTFNGKGGDFIHKNDLAAFVASEQRNFRTIKA